MALGKPFYLSAWVRIRTGVNDGLRVSLGGGGGDFTVTIPPGTYPLGFGASNPASSTDVTAYFGQTSLLQELQERVLAVTGQAWEFALQTEYNGTSGITASPSGHVWVKGTHVDDALNWVHADTTVEPFWFGVDDPSGVVATDLTTTFKDISGFSSTLAFVSQRNIYAEYLGHAYQDVATRSASGAQWWRMASRINKRQLRITVTGTPRDTHDSPYHSLRRFLDQLRNNGTGRQFYYIPDLSRLTWSNWDPDSADAGKRFGQERLQLDGDAAPFDFELRPKYGDVEREWELEIPVQGYVAA